MTRESLALTAAVTPPRSNGRFACLLTLLRAGAAATAVLLSTAMSASDRPVGIAQLANIAVFEYEGMTFEGGSDPAGFAWFRNELVFSAKDIFGDTELYSYDGREVRLLADINTQVLDWQPQSSSPSGFIRFGNELVFSADDGVSGRELWSYDGQRVRRIADLNQTLKNGVNQSSIPTGFVVFGNELVFSADDGVNGRELWGYDGRRVRLIADINPAVTQTCTRDRSGRETCVTVPQSSVPAGLTVFGGELVFRATDGITGEELWSYDGREVRQIANINQQPAPVGDRSSGAGGFVVFGGKLVFSATDGMTGGELWSYDGHDVRPLGEINVGPGGSFGMGFVGRVFGNELVFLATDGSTGEELWSYDGNIIRQVADINPSGSSSPGGLMVFGGELVFSAGSPDGRAIDRELWAYDGREVRQLANINPVGSSIPVRFALFGNAVVFVATDGASGAELWSYDGHEVRQLADINPAPKGSSNPSGLMAFGNELIFSADDGTTGTELWRLSHAGGQQ